MGTHLEINCPHCRQSFRQKVGEIKVKGSRPCPACNEKIEFAGSYIFRILRQLDSRRPFESRMSHPMPGER